MREKLQRFFQGRNGFDEYSRFLSWAAVAVLLVSMLTTSLLSGVLSTVFWILAIAMIVYGYFRVFSKNVYQRQAENRKYRQTAAKVKSAFKNFWQRIKDLKGYKYFKCPSCKATMRVPRHKGKVAITCKKCGERFTGKT